MWTCWFNKVIMVPKKTTHSTTTGYYVIKFFSEALTLQEDTTRDRKIIMDVELVVKA